MLIEPSCGSGRKESIYHCQPIMGATMGEIYNAYQTRPLECRDYKAHIISLFWMKGWDICTVLIKLGCESGGITKHMSSAYSG